MDKSSDIAAQGSVEHMVNLQASASQDAKHFDSELTGSDHINSDSRSATRDASQERGIDKPVVDRDDGTASASLASQGPANSLDDIAQPASRVGITKDKPVKDNASVNDHANGVTDGDGKAESLQQLDTSTPGLPTGKELAVHNTSSFPFKIPEHIKGQASHVPLGHSTPSLPQESQHTSPQSQDNGELDEDLTLSVAGSGQQAAHYVKHHRGVKHDIQAQAALNLQHQCVQSKQHDGYTQSLLARPIVCPRSARQESASGGSFGQSSQQADAPRGPSSTYMSSIKAQELEISYLKHQTELRRQALLAARSGAKVVSDGIGSGRPRTGMGSVSVSPFRQQAVPQGFPLQLGPQMTSQYPDYMSSPNGQMPINISQARNPGLGYVPGAQTGMISSTGNVMATKHSDGMGSREQQAMTEAGYGQRQYGQLVQLSEDRIKAQDWDFGEQKEDKEESGADCSDEDREDDDLPLIKRTKRNASTLNDSGNEDGEGEGEGEGDNDAFANSRNTSSGPISTAHGASVSHATNTPEASTHSSSPSSPNLELSFALPRYDVSLQPTKSSTALATAKVSLPGLVREPLLLSPDHSAQELHLLLHLFLPAQQALATPAPEPARAVLNFHTIAIMVVEAFVQFEIGDEFGTGRGHWHDAHDNDGEADYVRLRDARDADVEEIFFAVVDRWRAGRESGRKGLALVRGVQEFCDIALDVVFFIKEHGLLREEKAKTSKAKAKAQGKEEGPGDGDGEDELPKGRKRGAQKVNIGPARKKAKTVAAKEKPKPKPTPKPKAKASAKAAGIVVVKKGRK